MKLILGHKRVGALHIGWNWSYVISGLALLMAMHRTLFHERIGISLSLIVAALRQLSHKWVLQRYMWSSTSQKSCLKLIKRIMLNLISHMYENQSHIWTLSSHGWREACITILLLMEYTSKFSAPPAHLSSLFLPIEPSSWDLQSQRLGRHCSWPS